MKLYAYKQGSASAKALAQALGIKRIKHEGKPLRIKNEILINWGSSEYKRELLFSGTGRSLNFTHAVKKASNKLETFKALSGEVSIPGWTTRHEDAADWLAEGFTMVARNKLTGHSGEGIEIITPEQFGEGPVMFGAPLYTKYIKKRDEYRIHVFAGEVFFVQRKARKKDVPDDQVNWQVRNHANGFIYSHIDVEVPDEARTEAVNAVACLGLDFGAVDIIHGRDGKWYVLEVNTACGLEGTTLDKYVEQFKRYL